MNTLRITGGTMRGRRVPLPRETDIRPTSDRARQAFFNIVSPQLEGSRFLDLFSGTGVFAFEALSRGATRATAVDSSRPAIEQIRVTARKFEAGVEIIQGDAFATLKRWPAPTFDIIYADPPYGFARYQELLEKLDRCDALEPGAIVAIEYDSGSSPFTSEPERLRFRKSVRYGTVAIAFYDLPGTDELHDDSPSIDPNEHRDASGQDTPGGNFNNAPHAQ